MTEKKTPGLFRALGHLIPGYTGYVRREARRDTDKILRETIARRLDDVKPAVGDIIRERTAGGNLEGLSDLDRLRAHLGQSADMIRYASYGASGLFDLVQVNGREAVFRARAPGSVGWAVYRVADDGWLEYEDVSEEADSESGLVLRFAPSPFEQE